MFSYAALYLLIGGIVQGVFELVCHLEELPRVQMWPVTLAGVLFWPLTALTLVEWAIMRLK